MYIVSSNYRVHDQGFLWLIRKEDETVDTAVAHKNITATNVHFIPAPEEERRFGCTIVARCERAEGFDEDQKPFGPSIVKLHFDGLHFYHCSPVVQTIETCEGLILNSDYTMFALLSLTVPA